MDPLKAVCLCIFLLWDFWRLCFFFPRCLRAIPLWLRLQVRRYYLLHWQLHLSLLCMPCRSGFLFGLWKTRKYEVSNMDFTILAVVLLIGMGIPARNKLIRKFREEKRKWPRYKVIGIKNPNLPIARFVGIRPVTNREIPFSKTSPTFCPICKIDCLIGAEQFYVSIIKAPASHPKT